MFSIIAAHLNHLRTFQKKLSQTLRSSDSSLGGRLRLQYCFERSPDVYGVIPGLKSSDVASPRYVTNEEDGEQRGQATDLMSHCKEIPFARLKIPHVLILIPLYQIRARVWSRFLGQYKSQL